MCNEAEAKMVFYPVDDLRDDMICLQLDHTCDARPEKRWLPAYYFNICLLDGTKIGHCDLRSYYSQFGGFHSFPNFS